MFSRRFALGLLVVLCVLSTRSLAQTVDDPNWDVTALFGNGTLSQPTTMAFIGPNDFLVLEKATGIVKRVTNGVVSGTNVLDLPVNANSERGLLGIAVHPNFSQPNNNQVYLYYSLGTNANDQGSWV